ncbi:MAG: hypothetical protein R6U84_10510 [Candidatus Cloacimonadales bacterium]
MLASLDYVQAELQKFPQAQLLDIYKLFYQSAFGPGHIISDAVAARQYLQQELAQAQNYQAPAFQDIGYFNDYYRVNLALVAAAKIGFEEFFQAFLRSVQPQQKFSWQQWQTAWCQIDSELQAAGFSFAEAAADRQQIEQILSDQILVFSHSSVYKAAYQPHYRLLNHAGLQALGLL